MATQVSHEKGKDRRLRTAYTINWGRPASTAGSIRLEVRLGVSPLVGPVDWAHVFFETTDSDSDFVDKLHQEWQARHDHDPVLNNRPMSRSDDTPAVGLDLNPATEELWVVWVESGKQEQQIVTSTSDDLGNLGISVYYST